MLRGRKGFRLGSRVREIVVGLRKHFFFKLRPSFPPLNSKDHFKGPSSPCLSQNLQAACVTGSSGRLGKEAGLGQVPKRAL